MKEYLFYLSALSAGIAALASEPSLTFPHQEIGLPPLSLIAGNRPSLPALPVDPIAWSGSPKRPTISADKFVITPNDDVDYKLLIKRPDPSIDYRMIVKEAKVEMKK